MSPFTRPLIKLVQAAGEALLEAYHSKNFQVSRKSDGSVVTTADLQANQILSEGLLQISPEIAVVSEETRGTDSKQLPQEFWLVDPLDGTQGFIEGFDEFCICVALIQDRKPVLCVLYAPALKELYFAEKGKGAYLLLNGKPLRLPLAQKPSYFIAKSRHFSSAKERLFESLNHSTSSCCLGGAIKFGRVARGEVATYPRFVESKEWDTAAGQLLVEESGGVVLDLNTQGALAYGKMGFLNGSFIACHQPIENLHLVMPEK